MKPEDFASVITRHQKLPDFDSEKKPDISSPFPRPVPKDHRVVDIDEEDKIPKSIQWDYEAHVEYLLLPKDCDAYAEIINKALAGDALIRFEEKSFLKEGDCAVVICYLTRKPK